MPDPKQYEADVLIVGGGTSGVAAAIQSARLGANTLLVGYEPWLGGMLTAAGVSAIDGNHHLPSGIFGEFRAALTEHYGSKSALHTGWVSKTLFEPKIGATILDRMSDLPHLNRLFGYRVENVHVKDNCVSGASFVSPHAEPVLVNAKITIDATEYGDVLALAGCGYDLGRDSNQATGESFAPTEPDQAIQDLTYVAILENSGTRQGPTIEQPIDYDPSKFAGCCTEAGGKNTWSLAKMLSYGKLPGGKFMINWPNSGNDFYSNLVDCSYEERANRLEAAKNHTLGFVYFIQHELGMKNLSLAHSEFSSEDGLPYIPYIRESRRVHGKTRLIVDDIIDPYGNANRPLFKRSIAVGDYPLDHHHKQYPSPVCTNLPKIQAFSVPYECMLPARINGLIVAEKSISVSHLVNGCTRLQPVVMQIGQAAGAAAALCAKSGNQPANISVEQLQNILLDARSWLMPYADAGPGHPQFKAIQKVALKGLMRGFVANREWENRTEFRAEAAISKGEAEQIFAEAGIEFSNDKLRNLRTRGDVAEALHQSIGKQAGKLGTDLFVD